MTLGQDGGEHQRRRCGRRRRRRNLGDDVGVDAVRHLIAQGGLQLGCPREELTSQHPGGVNVLMGDGSVKFLKQTMDIKILAGLCTRNGGEVIDGGGY